MPIDISNFAKDQNGGQGGRQIQTVRTNSQSFAAGVFTSVILTWPVPFADTNYTVSVMLVDETNSGGLCLTNNMSGATGPAIHNKGTTLCVATVTNVGGAAVNGHVEAIAIHD